MEMILQSLKNKKKSFKITGGEPTEKKDTFNIILKLLTEHLNESIHKYIITVVYKLNLLSNR